MPTSRCRWCGSTYERALGTASWDHEEYCSSNPKQSHRLMLSAYLQEKGLGVSSLGTALHRVAEGVKPLHELSAEDLLPLAAEAGEEEIVQLLLERGVASYNGAQAAAARAGHKVIVALLVEHEAKNRAEGGLPIPHYRLPGGDPCTADLVSNQFLESPGPIWDSEALDLAAEKGHKEIVELLLNYSEAAGYEHAIRGASRAGQSEIVKWLLERGASPSAGLSGAVYAGPREMIEFLLERGAEPDESVCAMAAAYRDPGIVDLLLQHGGSPNWGLSDAACRGRKQIVALLLEKGAEPDSRNLRAAMNAGQWETAELLEKHGATLGNE